LTPLLLLLGVLILPPGCSKEELKAKLEEAQTKLETVAESTVEAVEERLPETGSIKLEMVPPAEAGQADLEMITIGDGRPNVIQIVTYDPSQAPREFPAILLHGTTTANSAAELANQTIECDLYLQATASGPIAMTSPGGSVAVAFGSLVVEDNALPASIGQATLVGSDFQSIDVRGGELVAVVAGEED
jgi:hypothetical protein